MKKFYLNPTYYNMWEHQQRYNKKGCCQCEFMREGVLLDSFLIYCKNGIALLQDHFLNCWTSDYYVMFARYNDKDDINEIWDVYEKVVAYDD